MLRYIKRGGKLNQGYTRQACNMNQQKLEWVVERNIRYWVAVVKPGRVFEIAGVPGNS